MHERSEDEAVTWSRRAAGYASARPDVHEPVIARVKRDLQLDEPVPLALDVGCGAGRSTGPLRDLATRCIGIDPSPAMVRAASIDVRARYLVARAEALPVRARTVDILAAAGSLDFADYPRFEVEAARVLRPGGVVVVYDFTPGRRFADPPAPPHGDGSDPLVVWYGEFRRRARRPFVAPDLRPTLAAGSSLALDHHEPLVVPVTMSQDAYVDYVMSDAPDPGDLALRTWCRGTIGGVFSTSHRVIAFDAYVAYLRPR